MTVQSDIPEIRELLTLFENIFEGVDLNKSMDNLTDREIAVLEDAFSKSIEIGEEIQRKLESHDLNGDVVKRFVNALEQDLKDHSARQIFVVRRTMVNHRSQSDRDWFERSEYLSSALLDSSIYYGVLHPDLFKVAKESWSNNSRISIQDAIPAEGYDYARVKLLEAHGIPGDSSTWLWAFEALNIASAWLDRIEIGCRLCDYVEWSCTEEPPNISNEVEFGSARLVQKAGFGARLPVDCGLERLESCVIWKKSHEVLVSPLWEYLSWGAYAFGELSKEVGYLGDIGEGLDSAVLLHEASADPFDRHRIRLTPNDIYRAGVAATKLRVAGELSEAALKGFRAEEIESLRAQKSGAHSHNSRNKRRVELLKNIERIADENPAFTRLPVEQVARLAAEDAKLANPQLWSQGFGQANEYLGELRRGEAGAGLQRRYFAIFPESQR
ncbi:MAG: hypothetical protein AAF667_16870 [Pseudomonadota bacterium]